MEKIVSIKKLNRILNSMEKNAVLTGGEFQFVFPEHIDLFNYAKEKNGITIVLVKDTQSHIPLEERLEILNSISAIDYIITSGEDSFISDIKKINGLEIIIQNKEFKLSGSDLKSIKNTEFFGK
ncbi:MAG: hypothetical protein ABFR75_07950 [Acidobacteriota bacterium]